jgi:Tol biopolymer transport system component
MQNKNKFGLLISLMVTIILIIGCTHNSNINNMEKQEGGTYNYQRVNLTLLPTSDAGMGGRPDWSFDGEWIAYDHKEEDGYWDIYRVHPDGSGEECLTCDHPYLPNRHIGNPAFSPDGRWLVITVEKESHPGGSAIALPGAGGYNDLWAMDISSDSPPYDVYLIHSVNDGFPAGGSLHPVFSHNGTKLFWSDRTGGGGEFGDWRLVIADFITTPSPHLESYQFYEPGDQDQWYESHGWGLDDSWIYFAGSPLMGMDDECMDICRMDFSDPNNVERLTWTSGINGEDCEWDEHAHMNPRGDIICWSSSMPYGYSERGSHQSDLWIMNLDGSGKRQVTFFNDPNPPNSLWVEYDSGGRRCSDKAWNPDGTKLVFFSFENGTGEYYYKDDQYLYILEFFINE